ncbi:Crp/Fnr family transcriptional regulator [Flavobacterium hungaricum]|uniref:Crp/Fnr family transcriptional regulator n=1 Tax=Flavobacterium hungaricum TaxID=2082725 RepID=A0ABR9TSE9_9FLAO|nr:Crp/Fnr family transcriptional regulator [Flavobacterium hungaricum]MBE8728295.1 Crp/Fnr family transcriptional regulator [Flavobacterium hungaricum]
MNISNILNAIHQLPEQSQLALLHTITEITFPKGHILLKANKVESNIYFIKKGLVRAYVERDNEVTFWFGKEGETIISMKSYVEEQPGYETIELLEDCELYELKTVHLKKLFNEDVNIANWGRKFAEKELIKTEERLISKQFKNASERYLDLMKDHPELLQRVQLGHIASYLGITQVSLSRIRAEIK